ncbi:MAG: asparagine synthase (glutamine-hydrolyzing) [Phycisphaerales bacterium]|nr:asparagine synthase (glutamine-hydrolyzing) [Phycisphaerales bacterium]
MCGILGGISVAPFSWLDGAERLRHGIDSMSHRGPDDRGEFISGNRRSFLGHRRLSIIDLEGGHQPISDEAECRHLCYNGEIYNYRELRKALLNRGHSFRTQTDGEVALHLYEEDPLGFAQSLQGMFAIAIQDEEAGCLTLVRDRNGIKPLFYFWDGRSLIFASEIKGILAFLPERPVVSQAALRQYLRWKYVPAPLTIFEGIQKLPAAHVLRAERNMKTRRIEIDIRPYWQLDYTGKKLADEREATDLLDEKLRASVKSHLEADVEVGALLSGGVDSSLVVALASTLSNRRIKTFSVGFKEAGFDQLPFARMVARKYDTDHYEELVELDPMSTVSRLVRHFDEPFADSSALACYRVSQVASNHVKVALTGDGGDESFAGYGRYEEVLDSALPVSRRRQRLSRAIVLSSEAIFSPEAKYLKRHRAVSYSPLQRHEEHQVMCSHWLIDKLLTESNPDDLHDLDIFDQHRQFAVDRDWAPVEVAQYVDLRMYLPDDILTKVDRTSMACSLECRVPLLDHSITEFSASLATELKIHHGIRKYLLKRLAERYVPRELLYRPKMGFRVPIRRWFKRELLGRTADLLMDGMLVSRDILNPRGLRWMVRHQRLPWIDLASHLWALLFLEHWARVYLA